MDIARVSSQWRLKHLPWTSSKVCEKCFLSHFWWHVTHWPFVWAFPGKQELCRTMPWPHLWCIYHLRISEENFKKLLQNFCSQLFRHWRVSCISSSFQIQLNSVNKSILYLGCIKDCVDCLGVFLIIQDSRGRRNSALGIDSGSDNGVSICWHSPAKEKVQWLLYFAFQSSWAPGFWAEVSDMSNTHTVQWHQPRAEGGNALRPSLFTRQAISQLSPCSTSNLRLGDVM